MRLEQGKLSPGTIRVKQGDMATLKIEAAEPGQLHLHGYDTVKEVAAGEAVDLFFVADVTGRFQVTFHAGGSAHGGIFKSELLGPGDAFTYEAAAAPANIVVKPGTAVTRTNNGSVAQTVVSGRHAGAFVGLEEPDSPAGEQEPLAGYLEVLPR